MCVWIGANQHTVVSMKGQQICIPFVEKRATGQQILHLAELHSGETGSLQEHLEN